MRKMTEENLKAAFAGESQAHLKYLTFSEKAKREGRENLARLFAAAAFSEQVHAANHLRALSGIGESAENLKAAWGGENFEIVEMYPAYIQVAQSQEEKPAEQTFHYALEAEKTHRAFYEGARTALENGKDIEAGPLQVCSNCGYTLRGEAPEKCPVCGVKKERFHQF